MRLRHFETLCPVCPRCQSLGQESWRLALQHIEKRRRDVVVEGALHCSNPECGLEFPIVDSIPIIVSDVGSLVRNQVGAITLRDDLAPATRSMLGDAAGQGSEFDTRRQHLSIYGWDGYAEFDDGETGQQRPGSIVSCLQAGLRHTGPLAGPLVDLGCGAGRTTFELARDTDEPVLGIDLGFSLLKLAQGVVDDGVARYPLRRSGVVYDEREVTTPFRDRDNVDFWLCDAMCLPFRDAGFESAVALNLLDCVPDPLALLNGIGRCLKPGGRAIVATPYDWSAAATAMENWLGGHSQRGPLQGRPEDYLRSVLTPTDSSGRGLVLRAEEQHVPWRTRLHDRSVVHYDVHVFTLELTA